MRTDFQQRNAAAIRRQAGMSLAEVLFASAIFAIILIAALVAYDRSNRVFTQGVETSDLQQSTRVAFEKLLSEVRMAGFDYDRDGSPSTGEQQPDEQIEFAGNSAITIRGNLDYFTDVANNHGLETDYVVADKFETVTTANEEIVTFALKSANNAKNIQPIKFYADVAMPRAAYPGGDPEDLVTIGSTTPGQGYDLCDDANGCSDPPYTLYRIALQRDGTPGTPVPIADNIHSLYFTYYTTTNQQTLATVTESGVTAMRTSHGAVGGLGQYDPDDVGGTANYGDRAMRGDIRSILVQLTGTTQNKYYANLRGDAAKRTYTLQTLVVPRNFGHQGSADPHLGPPSAPTIQSVCTGHCGIAHVAWLPSAAGAPVDEYYACYDLNAAGTFANCVPASLNLEVDVSAGLVPGQTYAFKVKAINSEGVTFSSSLSRTVRNNTQPGLPPVGRFTGVASETGIQLSWPRPTTNTSAFDDLLCSGAGSTNGTNIPSSERIQYTVWRSMNQNFTPGDPGSEMVVNNLNNQGAMMTIIDNPTNKITGTKGPAACKNYYYRLTTSDYCVSNASWNESNNIAIASNPAFVPPIADPAIGPFMMSPTTPATPVKPLGLVVDMANSSCNSGTNKCSINLDWNAVAAGTDSSVLAIDSYRIKRWQELGATRTAFPIDASAPDGYIVTGALLNGETFTDGWPGVGTTPQPPPKTNGAGLDYTYYYTVEAMNCSTVGAPSDEAKYPTCFFDLTAMTATGALVGNGSLGNEWVMASGDKLAITHPTRTITEVVWNVIKPDGTSLTGFPTAPDTSSPFELNWADRVDGVVYTVVASIKDSLGCIQSPTLIRYVKDQSPAICYPDVLSTTWGLEIDPGSGQTRYRTVNFNVTNNSTFEDMTLTGIDVSFVASTECTTGTPSANFAIDEITFGGAITDTTDRNPGTFSYTLPVSPAQTIVLNNGLNPTYPISVKFSYRGDRCADVSATMPITSMCLSYKLASEPGVTKKCNIIGTEINNPNSCN